MSSSPRKRRGLPAGVIEGASTPWKVTNELLRVLAIPAARFRFAISGVSFGANWRLFGLPIIQRHRRSTIRVGDHLSLRSTVRSNPLGPSHPVILSTRTPASEIVIGSNFAMTGGSIVAHERIRIGDRVTIGADCLVVDTDFHPLDPAIRNSEPTAGSTDPILIGDDVFIGAKSIILKGVTLGSRSVIGAGSVVSSNIPAGVIAAGNPAKVIRSL